MVPPVSISATGRPAQDAPSGVSTGAVPPSLRQRLRYQLKIAASEPTTLIGILMAALFAYLIVVPIIAMLLDALQVQLGDERRIKSDVGSLTWYYLERTFTSRVAHSLFWGPLVNTLSVAVGAIVIAMLVGGTLAWLLSRTDMFGRSWFATALIVPYMLPAWTFALAWTTLFKNRTVGGQAGWLESLGFSPPDWLAYGQLPVTIILALHYSPFIILLFGNALRRFDSQLEDSARILGAGRLTVVRQIILPLMRPALMSAMVLIFAKCLGEFGVPYVLGLPVNFDTLSTSLYQNIASRQSGVAAVLAASIMTIGIVTLAIDARLMREARRFVTIGSKGSMDRLSPLGSVPLAGDAAGGADLYPERGAAAADAVPVDGDEGAGALHPRQLHARLLDRHRPQHRGAADRHPAQPRPVERRLEQPQDRRHRLADLGAARAPGRLRGGAHAGAAALDLPAAGDLPALPRARHRLCRGLPLALRRAARADPGALRHLADPDAGADRRPDALCLAGRDLGDDAARQGSGGGGAGRRRRLVPPHDRRSSSRSRRAR